jgi:MFS family permease
MQAAAVSWYIFHITHDKLSLGLIGLAEAIPAIGIALYGGYVADKSEKTRLLKIILLTFLTGSGVMLIVTVPSVLHQIGQTAVVWTMFLMIFLMGIGRGFLGPTVFSMMAQIVPRELYTNSSTWSTTAFQTASIVGPAAGGLLIGFAGVPITFSVIVFFLMASFSCIFFLSPSPPKYVPKESIYRSLNEGIKFVFQNKMMLGAMSLDLFSVFFGGAVALLPAIASEVLHVGAKEYGIMRAAPAIGAVLIMLLSARYSPMHKPWRNLLLSVTGFGASIICYGLSKSYYLTLVFLFMEGAFDSVSVIIRQTLMQLLTPDHMRGRVSAVNSMFIGSSNEIGAFESGATAKLMGTVPAVIFGGSMTLGIVTLTWQKTKKLILLGVNDIHPPGPAEIKPAAG